MITLMRAAGPALALVTALHAACLPEGGPGVGAQLVAGRGLGHLAVAPPDQSGAIHVLFTRAPPGVAQYGEREIEPRPLLAVSGGGGPPRVLHARARSPYTHQRLWDATGRVYVSHVGDAEKVAPPGGFALARLDPGTGALAPVDQVVRAQLFLEGTVLLMRRPDGSAWLYDAGPTPVEPPPLAAGSAVREERAAWNELLFIDGRTLYRYRAGDERPQRLAGDVTQWLAVPGEGRRLLLVRGGTDGVSTLGLLDLTDRSERRLGTARLRAAPAVSPDGKRVALVEGTARELLLRVFELQETVEEQHPFPLPPYDPLIDGPRGTRPEGPTTIQLLFRPGSDELWCTVNRRLRIWRPGLPLLSLDALVQFQTALGSQASLAENDWRSEDILRDPVFTPDGRIVLFADGDGWLKLAQVTDAAGPGPRLVGGPGEDLRAAALVGAGRWLAIWSSRAGSREDLSVIELGNHTRRPLAERVGAVAIGDERALAVVRRIGDSGDLVLLDLASGVETVLARNVSRFALAPCAGCDATAPGTHLAYLVESPRPYQHDGLWLARLP